MISKNLHLVRQNSMWKCWEIPALVRPRHKTFWENNYGRLVWKKIISVEALLQKSFNISFSALFLPSLLLSMGAHPLVDSSDLFARPFLRFAENKVCLNFYWNLVFSNKFAVLSFSPGTVLHGPAALMKVLWISPHILCSTHLTSLLYRPLPNTFRLPPHLLSTRRQTITPAHLRRHTFEPGIMEHPLTPPTPPLIHVPLVRVIKSNFDSSAKPKFPTTKTVGTTDKTWTENERKKLKNAKVAFHSIRWLHMSLWKPRIQRMWRMKTALSSFHASYYNR